MPNILPVSDLRNYNEVLKNCRAGEPIFLLKTEEEDSLCLILKIMKKIEQKGNF